MANVFNKKMATNCLFYRPPVAITDSYLFSILFILIVGGIDHDIIINNRVIVIIWVSGSRQLPPDVGRLLVKIIVRQPIGKVAGRLLGLILGTLDAINNSAEPVAGF